MLSSSSQKGYRHDCSRSQSVTEGQGSLNQAQTDILFLSEAYNTVIPSKRAETSTRSLSGHSQSQPEGLQQCTEAQRVLNPFRSLRNCMKSYLTMRKSLDHPNACNLLNEWHPLMKRKYVTFNSRIEKKQPSTTQTDAKSSLSRQKWKFQYEKEATSSENGKRQITSYNHTSRATESQRFNRMLWKMWFRLPEP
ncbi:hypothetical protein O181_046424 [Austropuccinia psidii MF-1]|uniref:Uncharacterized protein n=1 Tax=Austropuccinia psidii MF-1 TaxID=1389203 RepID=A0A9Q3HL80_9BASI|nr:hypothetical protein [Austropuccinia psidii MF-1]